MNREHVCHGLPSSQPFKRRALQYTRAKELAAVRGSLDVPKSTVTLPPTNMAPDRGFIEKDIDLPGADAVLVGGRAINLLAGVPLKRPLADVPHREMARKPGPSQNQPSFLLGQVCAVASRVPSPRPRSPDKCATEFALEVCLPLAVACLLHVCFLGGRGGGWIYKVAVRAGLHGPGPNPSALPMFNYSIRAH